MTVLTDALIIAMLAAILAIVLMLLWAEAHRQIQRYEAGLLFPRKKRSNFEAMSDAPAMGFFTDPDTGDFYLAPIETERADA